MKQSLKSGIPEFDEAVEQFENGEINFVELTSRLWNKAYKIGQTEQCNIANVVKSLPNDEEVKAHIDTLPYYGTCTTEYNEGFEDGVKWLKEQLAK